MTGHHYDRTGERIGADSLLAPTSDALLDLAAEYAPRSPVEIAAHCDELRAVLRGTRARGSKPKPSTTAES